MDGQAAYVYRSGGRSVLNVAALGFAAAMVAGGAILGAPTVWLAVAGVPAAALAVVVLRNPVHGIDLDAGALTVVSPAGRRVLPLDRIECVEIETWSDSTDVVVRLAGGEAVNLRAEARPAAATLAAEMRRRGVRVTGDGG